MHKVRILEDHTISRKHLCVIRYFPLTCSKVESKSPESSRTSISVQKQAFLCIFYKIKSISLLFHIPTFVDCQLVRLWRVDMIILVSFVFGFVLLLGFYKSSSVCCLILLSSLNPFTSTCRLTRWSCRRRGCRIATSGDC